MQETNNGIVFDWSNFSSEDYARLLGYYEGLTDSDATRAFAWDADGQLSVSANGLTYGVFTVFDDAEDEPVLSLRLDNPFANPRDKINLSKTYFEMEGSLLRKRDYAAFQKSVERYISDDVMHGINMERVSDNILKTRNKAEAKKAIAEMQDK